MTREKKISVACEKKRLATPDIETLTHLITFEFGYIYWSYNMIYKLLKKIRRWHNLFNLLFIFVTASRVNNLTKTEAGPCHQNRKFQLWIGLTLLFVVLALVAASLAAYFLTGKPIITFVSGLYQSFWIFSQNLLIYSSLLKVWCLI